MISFVIEYYVTKKISITTKISMLALSHCNAFLITGLCVGLPQSPVDSPHKGPVLCSFHIFFDIGLNKLLNDQLSCW